MEPIITKEIQLKVMELNKLITDELVRALKKPRTEAHHCTKCSELVLGDEDGLCHKCV